MPSNLCYCIPCRCSHRIIKTFLIPPHSWWFYSLNAHTSFLLYFLDHHPVQALNLWPGTWFPVSPLSLVPNSWLKMFNQHTHGYPSLTIPFSLASCVFGTQKLENEGSGSWRPSWKDDNQIWDDQLGCHPCPDPTLPVGPPQHLDIAMLLQWTHIQRRGRTYSGGMQN